MNAPGRTHSAAHQAREPAAGPAAGDVREPASDSARPSGGTILDAIGNTPLVLVDGIWVKLEYLNPSGSIKARIAKYMIERAEREGLLRPGDTIVEASSGNTGNAMSMVAAVKGYRMLVVMPDGMSAERLAISRAFGADVMTVGDFHVNDALAKVAELGSRPGYFAPQQFDSEWNVEENRTWLGPETLAQLPEGVIPDAVIGGVGTGGTIVGVGQCFRERNPSCRVVAVEPNESCTLMCGEVGRHLIEGISDGFVPGIFARHRHLIDEVVAVDSDAAIAEMRRLAREFGLFVGPSSGAHLITARELRARDQGGTGGGLTERRPGTKRWRCCMPDTRQRRPGWPGSGIWWQCTRTSRLNSIEEIETVLGEHPLSFQDVPQLRYTNMVIKEALRLYVPTWILFPREVLTEVKIGGYVLPKRSWVLIFPYALHRDLRLV